MNTRIPVIIFMIAFVLVLVGTIIFGYQQGTPIKPSPPHIPTKWKLDCSAPRGNRCKPDPNGTYNDDNECEKAAENECGTIQNSYCAWADDEEQGITTQCDDKGPGGFFIKGVACANQECSKIAMEATYRLDMNTKKCMRCYPDAVPPPGSVCTYTGDKDTGKTGYELCQQALNSFYSGCVNGECVQKSFKPGTTPPSGWTKGFECSSPCVAGNGWCWDESANKCVVTQNGKCSDGSNPSSSKLDCCKAQMKVNGCITCDSGGNVQKLCGRDELDASRCDDNTLQCMCRFPETCNTSGPYPMNPKGGACNTEGCVGCVLQGSLGEDTCTSNVTMPIPTEKWEKKCTYVYGNEPDYMVCPRGGDCVLGTPITGSDDNDNALRKLHVCVDDLKTPCKKCSDVFPDKPTACCRYFNNVTTTPNPPTCYDPYDSSKNCKPVPVGN